MLCPVCGSCILCPFNAAKLNGKSKLFYHTHIQIQILTQTSDLLSISNYYPADVAATKTKKVARSRLVWHVAANLSLLNVPKKQLKYNQYAFFGL